MTRKNLTRVDDYIGAENASWSFEKLNPSLFDEHATKSIPSYREAHDLSVRLADYFVIAGSTVYDIGCSTGTLCSLISERTNEKQPNIVGIEPATEMAAHARQRTANVSNVTILDEQVQNVPLQDSSMIFALYTMQFINPAIRQHVFDSIYKSLQWGGAFVMFEKVRAPDARFQDIMTSLYNEFKLENGFSGNEIIAKSRSLKGVLEPFSTQGNLDLMKRAGFEDIITVHKNVCFEGFLAIK